MFTYSGEGTMPVSDIVGLHSYFQDNLIIYQGWLNLHFLLIQC